MVDLWRYRELLWILALRDIKVRYKQTLIGAAWAVIQPLTTMVIFTTLFRLMGQIPAENGPVPYAVSTFCALLPWQLFATALTQSSESLVSNQNLITKVYFPRIVIPISTVVAGLVDFAISFCILLAMMLFYGITPSWSILAIVPLIGLAGLAAFALGLWLSALTALFRDFRYVVPFLIQLGFFASPVVYETASLIPDKWQTLYWLNPMVGVLEGFRWAVLGKPAPPLAMLALSTGGILIVLTTGLVYFRRMERVFADRI